MSDQVDKHFRLGRGQRTDAQAREAEQTKEPDIVERLATQAGSHLMAAETTGEDDQIEWHTKQYELLTAAKAEITRLRRR